MSIIAETHTIPYIGDQKAGKAIYGEDPIEVTTVLVGGVESYRIRYNPYTVPAMSFTLTPFQAEVGRTLNNVLFQGSLNSGRNAVLSKTIVPATIPASDIDGSFSFVLPTVFRSAAGLGGKHTFTITNSAGTYTFEAGVNYLWRKYRGYSSLSAITAGDISGFASSLDHYRKTETHTIPAGGAYIYWLQQADEPPITSMKLSGFAVPFILQGTLSITNSLGVTGTYKVWRSSHKFYAGTLTNLEVL